MPIARVSFKPSSAAFVELTDGERPGALRPNDPITIGLDRLGALPGLDPGAFDVLLTTAHGAPAPWVSCIDLEADIQALSLATATHPMAAATLAGILRLGQDLPFDAALWLESLAYSTLLGGAEFRRWRMATPSRARPTPGEPVRLLRRPDRLGDTLVITLDDPSSRNAISPAMRDALVEALGVAVLDPTVREVVLAGAGPAFSSGGHLDDFGTATDLAQAHLIRTRQSPTALIHQLADRVVARLHGAVIGSGLELAAAAARVEAHPDTVFRLPEVAMGLIPGAGGTASLPRRIGRHRTAFMALSGHGIDTATALDWGLIDAIVRAS